MPSLPHAETTSMASKVSNKPPQPQAQDADALRDAALNYLARYAATEASLLRMLERRIDRWARLAQTAESDRDALAAQVAAAQQAARGVVARLAAAGAVNDAAFAESRVRSLMRAGRSRRAIGAHLAAKGVGAETRRNVLPDGAADAELAAALVLARRRRIGPFRAGDPPDAAGRRRELAILARAGFPQSVAARALDTDASEAEAVVNEFRR
ncbi:MAG: RecX family transcriptional regulator [Acetobacteraceae bacterium]|jgi:regulatory protein